MLLKTNCNKILTETTKLSHFCLKSYSRDHTDAPLALTPTARFFIKTDFVLYKRLAKMTTLGLNALNDVTEKQQRVFLTSSLIIEWCIN